jgi:hypothetical protein
MNPLTTIRPWLLATGKQFGIREVHEMRWHDADNKPREMYCTWRIMNSIDEGDDDVVFNLSTASGNNLVSKYAETTLTTVNIDLYNSQNGVYELKSMCAGIHHQSIRALFEEKAALISKVVTDESTWDDERIDYHQQAVLVFRENVANQITETNGVVTTIDIQLDDGTYFDEYEIDANGFRPKT